MVGADEDIAVLIDDVFRREPSLDPLTEAFDLFLAFRKCTDIDARDLIASLRAVHLTDDQLLRDVDKTSCEVSGVRRTKSGIRQTFAGAVR